MAEMEVMVNNSFPGYFYLRFSRNLVVLVIYMDLSLGFICT